MTFADWIGFKITTKLQAATDLISCFSIAVNIIIVVDFGLIVVTRAVFDDKSFAIQYDFECCLRLNKHLDVRTYFPHNKPVTRI